MRADPVTPTAEPRKPSTFNIEAPGAAEDGPTDYTAIELTITKLRAVLVGTASPSISWTLRFGPDRDAVGTEVVVGGTTTTSITTGDDITALTNPVIPTNNFLWLETTAASGTVSSIAVSAVYA